MGHVETRVYRAGALEAESFPVDAVSEWLEQPDTGRVGRPVRPDDTFPMSAVLDRRDRSPDLAAHGVGFLIYGLLDVVVDGSRRSTTTTTEISEGLFSEHPLAPSQQRDCPACAIPRSVAW